MSPKRMKFLFDNQVTADITMSDEDAGTAVKALTEGKYYAANDGNGTTHLINGRRSPRSRFRTSDFSLLNHMLVRRPRLG